MSTIFIDESGYTGEDLMNLKQHFFTLAALHFSEQEANNNVARFFGEVPAPQLSHVKLKEHEGGRRRILKFLEKIAQSPEFVKIYICDKRYALTSKIAHLLVKPAMKTAGIDLRIKGQDDALTYDMYRLIPELAGAAFFDDLLRRFQKMMICLDHESYHLFFDPLFDERYPGIHPEEDQRMLDFYLTFIKMAHTTVGYDLIDKFEETAQSLGVPHSRPLDVVSPGAMLLMKEWRKELTGGITLIHDRSDRMGEVIRMWQTIFHPHPPPALQHSGPGTTKFPVGIAEIYVKEKSEDWRGLQLADVIAGAARTWIEWVHGGRKPDGKYSKYAEKLETVISQLPLFLNWPRSPVTIEDFMKTGLTEEEAHAQDEEGEKLAAFYRIRAYGYSYQVNP